MEAIRFKLWAGIAIGTLLLAGSTYVAGVFVGRYGERLEQAQKKNQEFVDSITWVRNKELELVKETNNASSKYEKEIASINADAIAAKSELGRLRIKANRTCGVPTNSSAGQSKETSGSTTIGDTAGEINLDETANDILQLGYDIDVAHAQIIGLQKIVSICEGRSTK